MASVLETGGNKMSRYDGKKVKDWSVYVGKRCIVVENEYGGEDREVKVLEVSPSKKRIKIRFLSGHESWEGATNYLLIEALEEQEGIG